MGKFVAVVAAVLALCAASTLPARAEPLIGGTTKVSTLGDSLHPSCSGACEAFFATECPSRSARRHGITTSIVDVGELGGRTLRFEWRSSATSLHDDLHPTSGPLTPTARAFFYLVSGCEQPTWFTFALGSSPQGRTAEWTVPEGSTWLVVQGAEISTGITWWAEAVE